MMGGLKAGISKHLEEELGRYSMQNLIPISNKDVHKFIQEICQENLFLINLSNEEIENKEK